MSAFGFFLGRKGKNESQLAPWSTTETLFFEIAIHTCILLTCTTVLHFTSSSIPGPISPISEAQFICLLSLIYGVYRLDSPNTYLQIAGLIG